MSRWIVITAKFESICYVCGGIIPKDEIVYWKKHTGIKHYPQCPSESKQDDSRLVVIEPDEEFYLK